jgi:hypothetical protein
VSRRATAASLLPSPHRFTAKTPRPRSCLSVSYPPILTNPMLLVVDSLGALQTLTTQSTATSSSLERACSVIGAPSCAKLAVSSGMRDGEQPDWRKAGDASRLLKDLQLGSSQPVLSMAEQLALEAATIVNTERMSSRRVHQSRHRAQRSLQSLGFTPCDR